MTAVLVFTFVGADKPGVVEKLAHSVAQHGGNWLESRMSELAGQFAGIVKVGVAPAQAEPLRAALLALSGPALTLVVAPSLESAPAPAVRALRLRIMGHDRPGIVREVASALAARQINVREMDTTVTSAPMSGDPLFTADAHIQVPLGLDLDELNTQLDAISQALLVEIDLEASLR